MDAGQKEVETRRQVCESLQTRILQKRSLIIAANRGPVSFFYDEGGKLQYQRSGGGLVTALAGLAKHVDATWIASASTPADREWSSGEISMDGDNSIRVQFVLPDEPVYDAYYHVISNPLLWFLQHNMWDVARAPVIDQATWEAWEEGYVVVNQMFADAIAKQVRSNRQPTLIMLQDYHLYLVPRMLRNQLRRKAKYTLVYFVHIPWPGSEVWGLLPGGMRRSILESLCAVDLLGFQTREDGLNFIRSCETHLPRAATNFRHGRVWYRNHATHVRDFPISIDVDALRKFAKTQEVSEFNRQLRETLDHVKIILRIDRTDPSKNIVRGFQAFGEFLDLYPEFSEKVTFLALLAPSRLEVEEYKNYLDEIMAAAGRVNALFGNSQWEPVRVLVGDDYARAVAALQLYEVLLVNSIADGMNLVAKEGSIVNQQDGVLILSERTGARQQLEQGAIVIPPWDIYATAEAIHQALVMDPEERQDRAGRLSWIVEREDISDWLCRQLETIEDLGL